MRTRRRLTADARRDELLDTGERLFAARPFDDVLMEDVAAHAGVSRALLYRHFPTKRDLFAAVYRRAFDRVVAATELDPDRPLAEQVTAGLDAHLDYIVANRQIVLAANRTLAGDPVIQTIVSEEFDALGQRLIDVIGLGGPRREAVAAVLMSWLVFVRVLCVGWLAHPTCSRTELRDACTGALVGALAPILGSTLDREESSS